MASSFGFSKGIIWPQFLIKRYFPLYILLANSFKIIAEANRSFSAAINTIGICNLETCLAMFSLEEVAFN